MDKNIKLKEIYKSIRGELQIVNVSTLEHERIRKYVEKYPKAGRLLFSLLRYQAKIYWFIEDRKHDKNTSD
jgi:hypothetical protein